MGENKLPLPSCMAPLPSYLPKYIFSRQWKVTGRGAEACGASMVIETA